MRTEYLNKHTYNKFFAILLVSIVGLLVVNNALFVHFHQLDCGKIIVHAHPFNKSGEAQGNAGTPGEQHQHTKYQFLFFDNLSLLFVVLALTSAALLGNTTKRIVYSLQQSHSKRVTTSTHGRAPPYPTLQITC